MARCSRVLLVDLGSALPETNNSHLKNGWLKKMDPAYLQGKRVSFRDCSFISFCCFFRGFASNKLPPTLALESQPKGTILNLPKVFILSVDSWKGCVETDLGSGTGRGGESGGSDGIDGPRCWVISNQPMDVR